jgi:hypothetical protein
MIDTMAGDHSREARLAYPDASRVVFMCDIIAKVYRSGLTVARLFVQDKLSSPKILAAEGN